MTSSAPPLARDTFCSYCGEAYPPPLTYPRTCARCKTTVWANPIPVSVVLQPVLVNGRTGLLVVRRAIPPHIGKLGLVGGFVEEHESYQAGGAREVLEESGVVISADSLRPFWFSSSEPRPNRVLLFSVGQPIEAASLPAWQPNSEASARGLIFGAGGLAEVFAFPLHTEAVRRFFVELGAGGERLAHDYTDI